MRIREMAAVLLAACAAMPIQAQSSADSDVVTRLFTIKKVGKEGAGHVEAMDAYRGLTNCGPQYLITILGAMDDASPLAGNWIRGAYEVVLERAIASGKTVSQTDLEAFLRDQRHVGVARRLAYETLTRLDPTTPGRLLPTMLDDSGSELRRDAIDLLLAKTKSIKDDGELRDLYKKALHHAREKDQVAKIADQLKKLGVTIDLTKHLGFVTRWSCVGPFESAGGIGFAAVYPPDSAVDLKSEMTGKEKRTVKWQEHVTELPMGLVDFNKIIAPLHGTVGYAHAVVESPTERAVEIRAGSNNAIRIRLNGKEIYFREEYHHGMAMDQHVGKAILKAGRNEILVKVCQNEQTDSWAQLWSFQLRICDHLGGAVPFGNGRKGEAPAEPRTR